MDDLHTLLGYNRWATLRYLDVMDGLSREELGRSLGSSFPSLLETLVHLLAAEWVWLRRWQGESPTSFPEASTLDSIGALRARWDALWREQRAFLDGIDAAAPGAVVAYRAVDGSAFQHSLDVLVQHVVNHGTYHRGQLATLLRQLGHTPPSTDFTRYYREGR